MITKVSALACALVLACAVPSTGHPLPTGKKSGLCKVTADQYAPEMVWTTFRSCEPFRLNGKRTLFFAQLHLTCRVKPRWVKVRLARLTPWGIDSTGTNTWTVGKNMPTKWQGSITWESKTKWPMVAQFKYGGGSCVSTQRQFKWWQP